MKEIWKDIVGYEGLYQVSNLGRVKNVKRNTFIALNKNKDGYIQVNLWKHNNIKRIKTSRLVAICFLENPKNKPTVNHIDGNKENNCVNNLEWATRKEQSQHAVKLGLIKPSDYNKEMTRKMNRERKSVAVNQIDIKTNKIIKTWGSMSDVYRELGISPSCISRVCSGKRKQTHGYQWQYVWVKE